MQFIMSPGRGWRFGSWVVVLACLWCSGFALAFEAPPFQGDVLDESATLSAQEQDTLRERIRVLREQRGIWAAVYFAGSLQGDSIEGAADATFQKWKLGQAGKDNGLLVLIVPSERKMRIEVGYGLEGFITDAFSKRVIDEIYKPAFRQNQFADGLLQGFDAMAKMAAGEEMPALTSASAASDVNWGNAPRNFALSLFFNLLPPMWYAVAALYGRLHGRTGGESVWKTVKVPLIFGCFLGVFFGIFFAVFGAAFADEITPFVFIFGMNALFAGLITVPLLWQSRRFLSAAGYRRHLAHERLLRIRQHSKEPRMIFGKLFDPSQVSVSEGGTRIQTSSSGSSGSSSSSSSSSGGGRSGGGGASGSW